MKGRTRVVLWCGLWCDMVYLYGGMVWCGVVWCGMVWCDAEWCVLQAVGRVKRTADGGLRTDM
jgi:hypothetical protein